MGNFHSPSKQLFSEETESTVDVWAWGCCPWQGCAQHFGEKKGKKSSVSWSQGTYKSMLGEKCVEPHSQVILSCIHLLIRLSLVCTFYSVLYILNDIFLKLIMHDYSRTLEHYRLIHRDKITRNNPDFYQYWRIEYTVADAFCGLLIAVRKEQMKVFVHLEKMVHTRMSDKECKSRYKDIFILYSLLCKHNSNLPKKVWI